MIDGGDGVTFMARLKGEWCLDGSSLLCQMEASELTRAAPQSVRRHLIARLWEWETASLEGAVLLTRNNSPEMIRGGGG